VRRGEAFAGVAFPSPDRREGAVATERAAPAAVRGGVSLYLEAFAVATMVSGLMRLGAPTLLAQAVHREANEIILRDRAFGCRGAQPPRLVLGDSDDFGVTVVSTIESLCGGRW
jgi:hypothetical protein